MMGGLKINVQTQGLRPQNKIAAAFGSYGWSGEAVKILNKDFSEMKLDIIDDGVRVQYILDAGVKITKTLKKIIRREHV